MPLASGDKLGPFEILAPLGAGGMGEVYRARDTRLERTVAIKLLPTEFSTNSNRLHRFADEARSASALNHPNIVTIYELSQEGATPYIAMELVEGQTLRELLVTGLPPLRKTIEIAAQIAEGLTKAHEARITHRDLKPENIMVSHDGFVKILDFGLAKQVSSGGGSADLSNTSASLTGPGILLGTVGYMSPEQAEGLPLDFRSDQFSFGLVLYEMVTGERPFHRTTAAETLVAILREQAAPLAARNPDAPAPLCWAIERCLAKQPDNRYASTRELARELAAIRDCFSEKPVGQGETRSSNLPVSRTGFVGREKELAAAQDLLMRQDVRLLTITGPGGIGKTRLAVEVAGGLSASFSGGLHFVPLSPLSDPDLIVSVIVQTLGVREARGQTSQTSLEILKRNLQDSLHAPTLFVLDNFEHLIQAAPIVAELLAMAPHLKILVTSRSALHVYGEHEFPVPPLALPDARSAPSLETLSQSPAVALFVQRAVAAKPDFELNRENATVISEICARLDGLPLAIELAAARIKVLSPSSMLTRLASRLQLLTGGARDLPRRQQTLRAAMDWSHDLLNAAEQKLFRRLSVFVGGCDLEGVEAVCDTKGDLDLDLLDGMAAMVDRSLVQQVDHANGESRFVMLETIREYALEKLHASEEQALTKRSHAAYCLVLSEEETAEQGSTKWLERFGLEHNNFRAALDWLTETGDAEWGLRLGTALFRFWEIREFLAEGRERLGRLLKLPGAAPPTKARARALFAAGVLAGEQGDYASADRHIRESENIARQVGDKTGVAVSLNALAVFARDHGDLELAHTLFEESLALWRESGDQAAIARALSNLANVLKLQRDYERARALYVECFTIFCGLGDRAGVAWSLNYQGDVSRDQGDSETAQVLYQQALVIFRELNDRWGIAGTLADLGSLAREQRDRPTAHSLYRESITIFQELQHKRGIARLLECFACSAAAESQASRALRLAGAAAALRQNIGAPLTPAEQTKLEVSLEPARQAVSNAAGATAWLEGWALPAEKAIAEVLLPEGTARQD